MKQITIEISCCFSCPAYEYASAIEFAPPSHWCNELDRNIYPIENTIDPECPLPEVE